MPEIKRCSWGDTDDELSRKYHDEEWGKFNLDEKYLYEMLVLESFQSGLSWATILYKRENFRHAFADFDVEKVSKFTDADFERLMNDAGIIRNKLKINAAINNAQVLSNWHRNGNCFSTFLCEFIPNPIIHHFDSESDVPAKNELSAKISKEMKKQGFKFVGPTTIYSFLQAVGLINDHIEKCSFKY
ncbi:DNA-3-methyladenine glycosylase I [Lactobacillus hamsteri]|uniref:DNA-3-methyladenine glycosylase I n=1 Tax=Lactobacillus hamsteri DSM 5661 = JCM 6256 TaxID=1423754 RepID=A0A0R1YH92_9LACO|nr:DNA-3-methyladenine glycosylase I [Lactobacillus hamsteri]KRM40292.1 DNA-3-methyladenine glycosylase I [Lactobacillus hamsteri DSM 5661 = JCM 6256]